MAKIIAKDKVEFDELEKIIKTFPEGFLNQVTDIEKIDSRIYINMIGKYYKGSIENFKGQFTISLPANIDIIKIYKTEIMAFWDDNIVLRFTTKNTDNIIFDFTSFTPRKI